MYPEPRGAAAVASVVVAGRFPFLLERELELGRCSGGLDVWGVGLESKVGEDAYDHGRFGKNRIKC